MTNFGGFSGEKLREIVSKIEKLEEEKKEIAEYIKDIYSEAKAFGYDTKALRKIISIRKVNVSERMEQEAILETYMHALGMAPGSDNDDEKSEGDGDNQEAA